MMHYLRSIQPIHLIGIFLLIIIFSPYIIPRLRIDHLILLFLIFYFFFKGRFFSSPGIYLTIFYLIGFLVTFIRIIFFDDVLTRWSPFFDYMEWLLRGFIIYEFVRLALQDGIDTKDFILIFKIWVFSSLAIGFIALLQMIPFTASVANSFISKFYVNKDWLDAINGGSRSASIINHPGAYGQIFLLSIIIMLTARYELFHSQRLSNLLFFIIVLMSFFSLSKNILLGLPILFGLYILKLSFQPNTYSKLLFFLPFLLLAIILISLNLDIFYSLDLFLLDNLSSKMAYFYTVIKGAVILLLNSDALFQATLGVRYLESQTGDVTVFLENIFFGVGFTEHFLRLSDSGYTPFLLVGGLVGFIPLLMYMLSIISNSFEGLNRAEKSKSIFKIRIIFILIIFFNIIIGLGQQTFTLDKSGDFFFIMAAMLSVLKINKL